jgi:hypothetical protein
MQAANHARHSQEFDLRWANRCGPPLYLCQPSHPAASVVGDDNVEVSRTRMPQSLLLGQVGGCEGQYPRPGDPCPRGELKHWPWPSFFEGRCR